MPWTGVKASEEARLHDSKFGVRELVNCFVRVNIDDDLRDAATAGGGAGDSTQCDFTEFTEVLARLCNEKIPETQRTGEPFDMTLNSWLTLFFLPAVRTACKARMIKIA